MLKIMEEFVFILVKTEHLEIIIQEHVFQIVLQLFKDILIQQQICVLLLALMVGLHIMLLCNAEEIVLEDYLLIIQLENV